MRDTPSPLSPDALEGAASAAPVEWGGARALQPAPRTRRPPARLAPLFAVAFATAAVAAPADPNALFAGYGPAPFGTRWEKALTLFPTAEQMSQSKNLGSSNVGGVFVHRLLLDKQSIAGVAKPVQVELRFWKKKLWAVNVYFGENSTPEVLAMLTRALGPSEGTDPNSPFWFKGDVQTTVSPKQGWFGSTDLTLSADAQAWFKKLRKGQWKQASQAELDEMEDRTPVPGTPVPTPAGHVH
jgi:hypothetical protein